MFHGGCGTLALSPTTGAGAQADFYQVAVPDGTFDDRKVIAFLYSSVKTTTM